jgi:chemotaxis protein CheD
VKYGGERERFELKLFGGGRVIGNGKTLTDIGRLNIDFVHRYLAAEGLPVVAQSLGGTVARRVRYEPKTGVAMVNLMEMSLPALAEREARLLQTHHAAKLSEVTLFKP